MTSLDSGTQMGWLNRAYVPMIENVLAEGYEVAEIEMMFERLRAKWSE